MIVAAVTCVALAGAACGGGSSTKSSSNPPRSAGSDGNATGGADESAVQTYGYGPQPTDGVKYQPDVVMVPAGPAAIRSATSDGLVWTLDRVAKGVGDLKVGSILLATSAAAGRVVAIRDKGDSRVVTLAPIGLTDIIRDGEINLTHALSADSIVYQEVPDQPGAQSVPGDQDLAGAKASTSAARSGDGRVVTVSAPRLGLGARRGFGGLCLCGPSGGELPEANKQSVEIPAGPYKITPSYSAGELSLDFAREGAIKVGIHFGFAVSDLSVSAGVSIKGGSIGSSRFVINGINGLDVSVTAGSADGDNDKIKIEVPVKMSIPVPPSPATAGLPLMLAAEFTFSIATAITGKNSTVVASGKYGLSGPIGVEGGSFLSPKFTVQQSIIDSLQGITLGPSGVVLAVKMKLQAGIGIPAASAGPFGSITTSLGVTNGSSLGAALARCKGATLDMELGGGVSLDLSSSLLSALEQVLSQTLKLPDEPALKPINVLHRSQVVPDVPLCQGGGASGGGGGAAPVAG
jgi:hypothetical protein